jgi:hypothetical protein
MWTVGHTSLCVMNVTWTDLDPFAFILHFLNQFWIASRLVCSLYEAMAGSLSMATTAVLSAGFAVFYSGDVGRTVVYSRYSNVPRMLPWGSPALTGESSAYSVPTLTRKCLQ